MIVEPIKPPKTRKWVYPRAQFAKMYAPIEKVHPGDKLRSILKAKFERRKSEPEKAYLLSVGAYDALTASLLTQLGFESIYAGGWQLAVCRNMFPDIGIYPSYSMVELVREIIRGIEGTRDRHFYDTKGGVLRAPPIIADIEAGFGGQSQTFALTRELIKAGVGGVHLEDQNPVERIHGHIISQHGLRTAKTLVPTHQWIERLITIKAAVQATETNLVIIAKTGAVDGAVPGERGGMQATIERALEVASLGVDLIWPEFSNTDIDSPQEFAEGVHKYYPEQMLGFNLSPSLRWGQAKREDRLLENKELAKLGYVLQLSTLFAFRAVGMALETWLRSFRDRGLDALADLQLIESASLDAEPRTKMHQEFAGTSRWLHLERIGKTASLIES